MRYLLIILLLSFCFGQEKKIDKPIEKKIDRKTEIENEYKKFVIEINQYKINYYDALKNKEAAIKIIEQATKEKFNSENQILDSEKNIAEIITKLKNLQDEYLKITSEK